MFILLDKFHYERIGIYDSYEEALNKAIEISKIPWNIPPNKAPCTNWKKCGREYVIVERIKKNNKSLKVSEVDIFNISSNGVIWHVEFK